MSDTLAVAGGSTGSFVFRGDLALLLGTPALFAANMIVARWAESAGIPPVFLAFGRWALAFAVLVPIAAPALWAWRRAILAYWPRFLLLATLGMGVTVAPQYIGARETSAANIALIFAACPVLVMLLETAIWGAKPRSRQLAGMSAAMVGIAVVLGRGNPASLFNLAFGAGDLWVLLAACGWAGYTVASERFPLPPVPAVVRLAVLVGGGALVLAPFAGVEALHGEVPDFADGRLYAALAFLALVPSLGAYFCFDRLVRVAGPEGASLSMYLVPLYAVLAAWPLLGEIPQAFHVAGFMLILGGVLWAGSGRGVSAVRSGA